MDQMKDHKKIFISDGLKSMKFNEHTNHIDFEVRTHQNQIHWNPKTLSLGFIEFQDH